MNHPKVTKLNPAPVSKLSPKNRERQPRLGDRLLDYWASQCRYELGDAAAAEMLSEEAGVPMEKAERYLAHLGHKDMVGEIPSREPWEGDDETELRTPLHFPKAATGWRDRAYPLQLMQIQVQGMRHDTRESMIAKLEEAVARLRAGEDAGVVGDHDFGYRFEYRDNITGGSIFGPDDPQV